MYRMETGPACDGDEERGKERANRRQYLSALGSFAAVTIAGCSGGGGDTPTDDDEDDTQDSATATTTDDDGAGAGTPGDTTPGSGTETASGEGGCSPSLTYESYVFSAPGYSGEVARCDVPEAATIESSDFAFTVWYDYGGRDEDGVQREMRFDVETNYNQNVTVEQLANAVRDSWVEKTSEFSFADGGTRIFYQEDQPFPTDAQILLELPNGALLLDVNVGRKHCAETSQQIWQRLAGSAETV